MSQARQVKLMEQERPLPPPPWAHQHGPPAPAAWAAFPAPPPLLALPAPPTAAQQGRAEGNQRRLTLEEMAERRLQGLCFNCNEKYSRGHNRFCRRIFFVDGVEIDDAEGGAAVAGDDAATEAPVFSLHAVAGMAVGAPILLWVTLGATLKEMGFERSSHEAAMYWRSSGRAILLVGVYVDDLIITGTDEKKVAAFKAQMMKAFEMSDLGLLSFYLSVKVRQSASGINLRQTHYAERILELGGMESCNPAVTPMEERLKLSRFSTAEAVDPTHYRRLIGSLRYLVHTRPHIAFTVGFVSRFMEKPTMEHLAAMKRILRYLAGTLDYGLHFTRAPGSARFVGYCNIDLCGDIDTSKSTTGVLFFLGQCLVSWQSIKQKVVALSSCEAEYVAATTAATQGMWLSRLLAELLGRPVDIVELKVDSKSALALAKNPVFHKRSKHIRIKYHFIRSCLEDGSIKAEHISTGDQLADILTKALGKTKFEELRGRIGLEAISAKGNKGGELIAVGHVPSLAGPKYCPLQFSVFTMVVCVAVIGLLGVKKIRPLAAK